MKYVQSLCLLFLGLLLFGCGNGTPRLMRVSVNPATASASSSMRQQVRFTAIGQFDNNASRMLGAADGLQWSSGNTTVATVDSNGTATCMMPGSAQITATAATTTSKIVSATGSTTTSAGVLMNGMGVAGTPKVSGTGVLTCM
jgi:uncharacterized protein YjdB